ncbi:hypothetical protein [Azospirillum sp. B510]|uniref:hypothetical protein n=1 Tax=Azospirillum sp. (strain B510) TaxID=137722 RepID=UPI001B3BBD7D|nr:hypothetical protein [Azospirillum sp. B510]
MTIQWGWEKGAAPYPDCREASTASTAEVSASSRHHHTACLASGMMVIQACKPSVRHYSQKVGDDGGAEASFPMAGDEKIMSSRIHDGVRIFQERGN